MGGTAKPEPMRLHSCRAQNLNPTRLDKILRKQHLIGATDMPFPIVTPGVRYFRCGFQFRTRVIGDAVASSA